MGGIGGALLYLFKCPHRRISFPLTREGSTYITCLRCGAHRRYDLKRMRVHGRWSGKVPAELHRNNEQVAIELGS